MSDSNVRDQFFDLWSNRLGTEEAKRLKELIASDPTLEQQYKEDQFLFESLGELQQDTVQVPEGFSTLVTRAIEQRRLNTFWSKVMERLDSAFKGIGWLSLIVIGVPFVVVGTYAALHDFEGMSVPLSLMEGNVGVALMMFFTAYGILSLPTKHFRLAALTGTAAIAIFCIRTSISVFLDTDSMEAFTDEVDLSVASGRDKIVTVEKEAPAAVAKNETRPQEIHKKADAAPLIGVVPQQSNSVAAAGRRLMEGQFGSGALVAPAPADMAIMPYQEENREGYGHEEINPRVAVQTQSVSTFSMDVDTGSYSNVRRFLRSGRLPPKDAVRIEELVNYFPYNYKADSDKPFTPNFEIAPSPMNPGRYLLRIGLKAKDAAQDTSKGWNLVFLVDTSGSMNDQNKLPLVKQSLKLLTDSMRSQDRISLVTYAGAAGVALPSTPGTDKAKIKAAIDSLGAGGSTNGSGGINAAYDQAIQNKIDGSVNRVILATDGDFNVGITDFNGLINLIEEKRKSGVTLTTLGFGTGNYQEHSMEQLADKGDGNYFYIDSFQEARKVLASELTQAMEVVAKDTKLQIEFNPAQVSEYRLVGFDNRILKNEDFVNDKVDAGEVGSGHTVTALYELTLTSHPVKGEAIDLRYQKAAPTATPATLTGELGFLKIRAKAPQGGASTEYSYPVSASMVKSSIDEATDDFKFAAAVASYGEILRDSKYQGSVTWSEVRALAQKGKGDDQFGYRSEFLSLVDAASSLTTNGK